MKITAQNVLRQIFEAARGKCEKDIEYKPFNSFKGSRIHGFVLLQRLDKETELELANEIFVFIAKSDINIQLCVSAIELAATLPNDMFKELYNCLNDERNNTSYIYFEEERPNGCNIIIYLTNSDLIKLKKRNPEISPFHNI